MAKRFTFLKILVVILCLMPTGAWGQWWYTPLDISFDPGDTVYQHAIVIDTVSHHHNSWQIGKPNKLVFDSAYSYPNAIVTDTLNPYLPNDTSVFVMRLRNFLVMPGWWHEIAHISFEYKMDIDSGSFGIIEVSDDTGHTWKIAGNVMPYIPDTVTFTHSTSGWKTYSILPAWSLVDTILIRFTFISDTNVSTKDGLIIDNIHVAYMTEDVPMLQDHGYNIYPNPAHEIVGISAKERIHTLAIRNIMGQQVYGRDYDATDITVEVKQLPPGLYFVNINGVVAGKFLKE